MHLVGIESPGLTAAPALAVRVARVVDELLGGGGEPSKGCFQPPPPRFGF